eukprot:m.111496 g.111496  ORF g.111496 m.111496 type:complete len:797 (+) comp15386_c0_seq2:358-2748(+)
MWRIVCTALVASLLAAARGRSSWQQQSISQHTSSFIRHENRVLATEGDLWVVYDVSSLVQLTKRVLNISFHSTNRRPNSVAVASQLLAFQVDSSIITVLNDTSNQRLDLLFPDLRAWTLADGCLFTANSSAISSTCWEHALGLPPVSTTTMAFSTLGLHDNAMLVLAANATELWYATRQGDVLGRWRHQEEESAYWKLNTTSATIVTVCGDWLVHASNQHVSVVRPTGTRVFAINLTLPSDAFNHQQLYYLGCDATLIALVTNISQQAIAYQRHYDPIRGDDDWQSHRFDIPSHPPCIPHITRSLFSCLELRRGQQLNIHFIPWAPLGPFGEPRTWLLWSTAYSSSSPQHTSTASMTNTLVVTQPEPTRSSILSSSSTSSLKPTVIAVVILSLAVAISMGLLLWRRQSRIDGQSYILLASKDLTDKAGTLENEDGDEMLSQLNSFTSSSPSSDPVTEDPTSSPLSAFTATDQHSEPALLDLDIDQLSSHYAVDDTDSATNPATVLQTLLSQPYADASTAHKKLTRALQVSGLVIDDLETADQVPLLMNAIRSDARELVAAVLVSWEDQVLLRDRHGQTCLHVLVATATDLTLSIAMLQSLKQSLESSPEEARGLLAARDQLTRKTPLELAIVLNEPRLVMALLHWHPNQLTEKAWEGSTLLHLAASQGMHCMLLWLLELDNGLLRNMLLTENSEGLRFYTTTGDPEQDGIAEGICNSHMANLIRNGETELDFAKRAQQRKDFHRSRRRVSSSGNQNTSSNYDPIQASIAWQAVVERVANDQLQIAPAALKAFEDNL